MGRHEGEAMGRETDLVLDASLLKHKNLVVHVCNKIYHVLFFEKYPLLNFCQRLYFTDMKRTCLILILSRTKKIYWRTFKSFYLYMNNSGTKVSC